MVPRAVARSTVNQPHGYDDLVAPLRRPQADESGVYGYVNFIRPRDDGPTWPHLALDQR